MNGLAKRRGNKLGTALLNCHVDSIHSSWDLAGHPNLCPGVCWEMHQAKPGFLQRAQENQIFLSFEALLLTPANCQVALETYGQSLQFVKHLLITGQDHLGSKSSLSSHQISLAWLHLYPARPDPGDLFPVEPAVPACGQTSCTAGQSVIGLKSKTISSLLKLCSGIAPLQLGWWLCSPGATPKSNNHVLCKHLHHFYPLPSSCL